MSSLVDSLRKAGRVHARGEFTLDAEKADAKLARFQFRQDFEFLYQMVAGLYRLGVARVDVELPGAGQLTVRLDRLVLPNNFPTNLADHVLEEFSPWRRLAAACQAVLAHQPDSFEWIGQVKDQRYDYLNGQSKAWKGVTLAEIRLTGLKGELVDQALHELRRRAIHHQRHLTLAGKPVIGRTDPLTQLSGHPGFFACQPGAPSELVLVVDQMVTEPRALNSEIPWQGVIYWDIPQLAMDASLAAVVEDDRLARLLQSIPETYAHCVLNLRSRWETPDVRTFLLDLLRPPAPRWLHSIYADLSRLDFFVDQHEQPWSLATLLRQCQLKEEPLYYAMTSLPSDLPDVILRITSLSALDCLKIHFSDRLQEATPLILRQLRARANRETWQNRPLLGLQLPAQNWLAQRTDSNCLMAIPDDWSQPGGSVSLLHQGKFLGRRHLAQGEVPFVVVYELAQEEIGDLWDDILEDRWLQLVPHWQQQLQEMLEGLAHGHEGPHPLRSHLLKHLARCPKPEESYFAHTFLFQDWTGQLHSIDRLLQAKSDGYGVGRVGPAHKPEDYPSRFLPKAIYLRDEGPEGPCLEKVKSLSLRNFDLLLKDLLWARRAPMPPPLQQAWTVTHECENYRSSLEVMPHWKFGKVRLWIQGVPIQDETIESEVGFVAHVHSDEFKLEIRSGNSELGLGRYSVANLAPWRRCRANLLAQVESSLKLRLEHLPAALREWSDWLHEAALQGYAKNYPNLANHVHFPAFPEPLSLAAVRSQSTLHWHSEKPELRAVKDFLEQHPGVSLLAPLSLTHQQQLQAAYGGNWVNEEGWFSQDKSLRQFLQRPPAQFGHTDMLSSAPARAPLQGLLLLVATLDSDIYWHHRQRRINRLPSPAWSLVAQLESDQLQPTPDFNALGPPERLAELQAEAARQLTDLLVAWLSTPRPEQWLFLGRWTEWQKLGPRVVEALCRQPWLDTNHGRRSWNDLMQVDTLYSLPELASCKVTDLTILECGSWGNAVTSQLIAAHPRSLSMADTRAYLEERQRQQERLSSLRRQSERLASFPYRCRLDPPHAGEVALLNATRKDLWLITEDRPVVVHNLPAGLTGYLVSTDYQITSQGEPPQAELGQAARFQVLLQLLPLILDRIEAGKLSPAEVQFVAEYALHALPPHPDDSPWEALMAARWIPCADGTRTSLHQLQLESEEQGQLLYWEMKYPLSSSRALTPLLNSPLLLELVHRCCRTYPTLRPKPLLFREVSLRGLIEGLGRWISARPGRGLVQNFRQSMRETETPPVGPVEFGLVNALRRQAAQMLQGLARAETLASLDRIGWSQDRKPPGLFQLAKDGSLLLYARHPRLSPWLGEQEPPAPVTLSLLLGLVSLINARSVSFSDQMESQFLEHLLHDVVSTYQDVIGTAQKVPVA